MKDTYLEERVGKNAATKERESKLYQKGLETQNQELKLTQMELEFTMNKYADLYDNAPIGYITLNEEDAVIEANLTISEMLRVERHEFIGESFYSYIVPEDHDAHFLFKRKLISTKTRHNCELRLTRCDGKLIHAKLEGRADVNANGKSLFKIVIVDNTVSKLLENNLRQSEKKYRSLIENLDETLFRIAMPSGRVEYISPSAARLFELPLEQFFFMPNALERIIHPDSRKCLRDVWQSALQGKIEHIFEYKIITPRGQEKWIRQSNSIVNDENGTMISIEGICRDVTESRLYEDRLRESDERFRAIANYTYDWESWIGLDGKLLWVNPSVERMTGYNPGECALMSDFPATIIHEEDVEAFRENFKKSIEQNIGTHDFEFRIRRKNGYVLWVSACWQPICAQDGSPNGIRMSVRDISERKENEERLLTLVDELRRSNEIISSNMVELNETRYKLQFSQRNLRELHARKDEFFSLVSRELIDLFTRSQRLSKVIKSEGFQGNEEFVKGFVGDLEGSVHNTLRMIENYFRQASAPLGR
ncbi:MAG: PAS domain S-box protein [Chloroflexota bacterium]